LAAELYTTSMKARKATYAAVAGLYAGSSSGTARALAG
jgi:hypothetical protein